MKYKIIKILLLLLAFWSIRCANQLPPGGGEIDTIPPKIIELEPENRTINFQENYFEVGFSEYIDKRTFKDAIFISPPLDGIPELSWSGKYVRVYFPETLKKDVTYSVTIGTDVVDYNNRNRMDSAFTFAFSTGDRIDNGKIEGFIHTEKPSGVMLFAYKILSADSVYNSGDTINPALHKPDYISQTGNNGYYKLDYLSYGKYRVFAVMDEYRDRVFNPEQDLIGVPHQDVSLSEEDSSFFGLNFFINKIDTVAPRLLTAVMTDKNHILVSASEEPDTSTYKIDNFFVVDSSYRFLFKPIYIFKGKTKEKDFVLSVDTLLNPVNTYYLITNYLSDQKNNIRKADTIVITTVDRPDTTKPSIYSSVPNNNSNNIDYKKVEFVFKADDAFNIERLKDKIELTDTLKNIVPLSFKRIDDASWQVSPRSELKPETDYQIKFSYKEIVDAAGNTLGDSLFRYNFKTITGLEFTGLSGSVEYVDFGQNPILVLINKDNPSIMYKQVPTSDYKFSFERVIPGTYTLYCFLDKNGNNEYDIGFPFEFIPSEAFSFHNEEIKLPARWSVSNFRFVFNQKIF